MPQGNRSRGIRLLPNDYIILKFLLAKEYNEFRGVGNFSGLDKHVNMMKTLYDKLVTYEGKYLSDSVLEVGETRIQKKRRVRTKAHKK